MPKMEEMKKLLLLGVCIALLPIFTISGINAQPPCERMSLESRNNRDGKWVSPNEKDFKWYPDYCDRNGLWIQKSSNNLILAFCD